MGIGTHSKPFRGATDDWCTPPEIVQALGPFDLDPCACDPQPFRTAEIQLTRHGLISWWNGRIWLNPPYGPEATKWLGKLANHGNGTALVFARTETAMFFQHVWPKADALLFIEGRLHFHRPDGTRAKANSGAPSVLIAYGRRDAWILINSKIRGARVPLKSL